MSTMTTHKPRAAISKRLSASPRLLRGRMVLRTPENRRTLAVIALGGPIIGYVIARGLLWLVVGE
jgi:hypothetical protein